MASVYDIEPQEFIHKLKGRLKEKKEIKQPGWASFVKTGAGKERPPQQPDWWFLRAASLLRKLYIHGPLGVARLSKLYSSRKRRGTKPEKSYRSGKKIIRTLLQKLETTGFIKKVEEGRTLTKKGRSFLDKLADEIK